MGRNHWHPDNKPRRWKRSQVGAHADRWNRVIAIVALIGILMLALFALLGNYRLQLFF